MSADQLLEIMLSNTFVKADLLRRLRLIREYIEQKYFTPGEKKELQPFLAGQSIEKDEQEAITSWGSEFYASFTKNTAYDALEHINDRIKKLPVVNLYVSVPLGLEDRMKIGRWFRANADRWILMELHIDRTAFGGCAFAWEGTYHDYSLHYYLHKKKADIGKIIDNFDTKS